MARKSLNYTVVDDGRDKGKCFVLNEMPMAKAEAWAMRALLALMNAGVDMPDDFATLGMAGMAEIGFKSLSRLKWDIAEPLINEMMECVQVMPDPSKSHIVRPLFEGDIEEVQTSIKLRIQVWKLHVDFSPAGNRLTSGQEQVPTEKRQSAKMSRV